MRIILALGLLLLANPSISAQEPGWQWLNPKPQGNGVSSMYFTSDMVGYAATQSNCVMKTTTGGISWELKYIPAEISLKEVQFLNSQTGYISTTTNKLCKTTNAGENWVVIEALQSGINFGTITFNDENTGYATYGITYNGTRLAGKTTNGGVNWIDIWSDTLCKQSRILSNKGELFIADTRSGNPDTTFIYKSVNNGINWFKISQFPFYSMREFRFTSSSIGFLQLYNSNYKKLYKTTDGGNNWSFIKDSVDNFQSLDDNSLLSIDYSRNNIYKSLNGGLNWMVYNLPNQPNSSNFSDYGNYYFVNVNTGIITGVNYIRTTNGGTNWNTTTDNIITHFWGMDFIDPNTGFLSGSNQKTYKTTNGGLDWELNLSHSQDFEEIQFIDSETGFMGGVGGHFAKTTNAGINWDTSKITNISSITGISFPDANTGYVTAKYGPVSKTTNGGISWTTLTNVYYQSWDIDFINVNTGLVCSGGAFKRTSNGGISWDSITIPWDSYVYKIRFIDENEVLAGTLGSGNQDPYILKSSNGGVNWVIVYTPEQGVGEIETVGNIIYANGYNSGKVFKSTDRGNTWRTYNTISNNSPYRIKFVNENTGYICGFYGSLIKTTNGGFDPIGIEPISNEIPDKFFLHQNYPNPFNPATKIKFSLPKAGLVSLNIYNLLGQQVTELVNQNLNAGIYEYTFDGGRLPSGVYFYRLETGGVIETKRMMLVK